MAFIIPWIFRAGTKAKSAEVNENFLAVKQFVDLLEEDIAANQIMVQTLDDTKANINGNPTERFQVATAIVGNDAVNLNTLEKNTQNARGYIDGYRLSATTRVVTATRGSCYSDKQNDGDYEYLIKSDTAISTSTLTLGANARYYIFVCGSEDGTVYPELSVTVNSTTPPLPEGTDCWRRLGYFTTDEDGNIDEILNEGQQSLKRFITHAYINPRVVVKTLSNNVEWEATQDCYLVAAFKGENCWAKVTLDGVVIIDNTSGTGRSTAEDFVFPIKKEQTIKIEGNLVSAKAYAMM